MWSHKNSTLPQSGGSLTNTELLSEEPGVHAQYQAPHPWNLHHKRSPQKVCLWKQTGYIQEAHWGIGSRDFTPKGLTHTVTHPGAEHKNSSLKSTETVCEEIHLLILKHLLEGQALILLSLGAE